jgi:3-dehydroquinate dehydratase-1
VGDAPRVVGVISSVEGFRTLNEFPCDLVEVRLDTIGQPPGWLKRCQEIESSGKPVLLTMRLKSEGGSCALADEARLPIFAEALKLSAVDIELRSPLSSEVARMAAALAKGCVLSFHDFQKTLPLEELQSVVAEAQTLGGVTKIATMIHSKDDVACLKSLLKTPRQQPLCVIGMGEAWTHLRVQLAELGSCLTYGYLDSSAAPGQISASALFVALQRL